VIAPRSLRGQLLLAFTGFASFVVLAAAIAMVVLIRYAVWAPLDAKLEEEADTLSTLLWDRPEGLPEAVARIANETDLGAPKFIRVISRDGRTVAQSGSQAVAPLGLSRAESVGRATVGGDGDAYRMVRHAASGGGWIEIGVSAPGRLRVLRQATWGVAAGALILLASLVALAAAVTGRATAELARLATELETVEAGSLDRRLAPRRTTEVDRLATVLNRLLARLEAALGHLRRFTADAAHELRTPIAAVRARIEVALAGARSPEAYRDGLLDTLEQTERLERLAADLLTLSAIEAGRAGDELVRLDALAREVAEFLEPVAQEQGRDFSCRAERPVTVRGTPDLLKRLILNLVDNAFRHTAPSAAVELSVSVDGTTSAIEVRDRGAGIDDIDLPVVFERFRRGRTSTSGTGLGLALCQEIATRHGGGVALRSAPGRGTVVRVTLPLADVTPPT
jgi:signal transduction histidine kinase